MATSPVVSAPSSMPQQLLGSPIADQNGIVTRIWQKFFQGLPKASQSATLIQGTHASRANILASQYVTGSIFFESDRQVWYVAIKGAWTYIAGVAQTIQASIPADLGIADAGFLCFVTDYAHLLQWTGTGWQWGPGDLGSDFISAFLSGPTTAGWQACDGSANVSQMNSDGTLNLVTVPNTPGSWYRQ